MKPFQYLENYLWPNFNPEESSKAHVMSIVMMVNEKFRERVPAWVPFQKLPEHFQAFFHRIMSLSLLDTDTGDGDQKSVTLKEQTSLLVFLDHCFTSMEVDLVRTQIQRLVSVSSNFFKLVPIPASFFSLSLVTLLDHN